MSDELEDIAATFGTSEPIFDVTMDSRGDLVFVPKNTYTPPVSTDPIHNMVADTWSEYFDKYLKNYQGRVNLEGVYERVENAIIDIFLSSSTLKNPKQCKLYKWLNSNRLMYKDPLAKGFISLYRYAAANNIMRNRDKTNPHALNVIAILELIREKYEKQASSN